MPRYFWSLMTTDVKPIISADISSMIISAAISAMPRSWPRTRRRDVCWARMAILKVLLVAIHVCEAPHADDGRQMIAEVVFLLRRHVFRTHADVNVDFPNLARGVRVAAQRVRQVFHVRRVDRAVHHVVAQLQVFDDAGERLRGEEVELTNQVGLVWRRS